MICINQLNFAVGNFALSDVSLRVKPGEYFVLLGPTGSGKTLLVECLCGLNRIGSGRIIIGGSDVTNWEPRRRGIGYVPQDYALFPHQTVRQNIGFGAGNLLGGSRAEKRRSVQLLVAGVMELIGISRLADRYPAKLSGGEKQRVALARALAAQPKVLLLDEPVSALDEQTRDAICRELKQLQRQSATTTMHICHNFAEMLAVADRVGIIDGGRILQVGTPQEVLGRPCSARVARFVQAGNLLPAKARSDGEWIELACAGNLTLRAAKSASPAGADEVTVMVRPENIRLEAARPENTPPGTTVLEGPIRNVVDLGPVVKVTVACGPKVELLCSLGKKEYHDCGVDVGERVYLAVTPEDVHVMDQ